MTTPARPAFSHAAEAEVSKILTFYGVRWEYEPHTFVLRADEQGVPFELFTPDFWLPDLNTYLEVTTMKQHNTRDKHRKIREFSALHPEVGIVLLEGHDIVSLLTKFGCRSRLPDLMGARGQLV